jgi:hypothetical protein
MSIQLSPVLTIVDSVEINLARMLIPLIIQRIRNRDWVAHAAAAFRIFVVFAVGEDFGAQQTQSSSRVLCRPITR